MADQRSRTFEIAAALRGSNAPEVALIVEFLGIAVESTRDDLVSAPPETVLKAQGAAQLAHKLYKLLTQNAPNQRQEI